MVNGPHYQFTVLPFDLSATLRVFTKCMAVVAAFLQRLGGHVFPYLDDWLLRDQSKSRVLSSVATIQSTFDLLGS